MNSIDSQLQDVPLPAGLLRRLREVVASDDALDDELRNVPLPAGLAARVADAVLDEALAETPEAPSRVLVQLRRTPQLVRAAGAARRRVGQWMVAASLMLVLTGMHWSGMYGILLSLRPAASAPRLLVVEREPLQLQGALAEPQPPLVLEPLDAPRPSDAPNAAVELVRLALPAADGPFGQLSQQLRTGLDLEQTMLEARLAGQDEDPSYLGFPLREPPPPAWIEEVSAPAYNGPPLPVDPRYDRAFHWRNGVSPWAPPTRALRRTAVPLQADPAQFDRLSEQIRAGRPPRADEVRIEDVVATLNYRFPLPPPGRLGLLTAAGPGVFGEENTGLLQVGVQAGAPPGRAPQPLHLTVLLDISQAMSPVAAAQLRRVLFAQLRLLNDDDELTVVTLCDAPRVVCERSGRDQLEALSRWLHDRRPVGAADWGLAFPLALQASSAGSAARNELVVLSSGSGQWTAAAEPLMEEMIESAVESGLSIRVAACQGAAQPGQARLRKWIEDRGLSWQQGDIDAARDSLCQAITGKSGPLASQVKLVLEFNPEAVAAYRILGHDARAPQWTGAEQAWEMSPGEQAAVLAEIRWQAATTDDVAWAELTWRDSQGRLQKARQRISRLQWASSFQQSPPSLQAAALAAETGQILSESPFAKGRGHTLQDVLNQALEAGAVTAARADLQQLLQVVRQARLLPQRRANEEN